MDSTVSATDRLLSGTDEMMMGDGEYTGLTRSHELLSIVEEWRRKSSEITKISDDVLINVFDKGFDAMSVVLTQNYEEAKVALDNLHYSRKDLQENDDIKPDEIRKLLYGFVQSVHFTLNQLVEEKNELKLTIENWNRAEEMNFSPVDLPQMMENSSEESPLEEEMELNPTGFLGEAAVKIEEPDEEPVPFGEPFEDLHEVVKTNGVQKKVRRSRVDNGRENTLKCPDCTMTLSFLSSFITHLKGVHGKTMGEAQIVFRCDCGAESQSRNHKCPIARFSIAHTNSVPIRRSNVQKELRGLNEEPKDTVPSPKNKLVLGRKCVIKQCTKRPATACGYVKHINSHKLSLNKAGIKHLLCSCGLQATSNSSFTKDHTATCGGTDFAIIRLRTRKEK